MTNKRASAAFVVVSDPHGNVLLLHRTETHPRYPNCWTLPGGKIERGETSHQAAINELREEAGIIAKRLRFVKRIQVKGYGVDYYCLRVPKIGVVLDDEHNRAVLIPQGSIGSVPQRDDVLRSISPYIRSLR